MNWNSHLDIIYSAGFFMEMVTQMVSIQRIYSSVAIVAIVAIVEFEWHLLSVQMTI